MTITVSNKGHIVLPAALRRQDDIKPGQEFEVKRLEQGAYLIKRRGQRRHHGLVKLLLACPVKDWFQPATRRETTDDILLPKIG
jgi:AbrB family looped-hinge helix DNA binding protein